MSNIFHRKTGRHELPKPHKRSRVIAATLVAVLLLSLAFPVFAAALSPNTPKQEVVYVKLNSDGSVREISVVNIFDLSEAGEIIDYGDYTALRNMTTNDEIVFENETVRIDTNAGKLYYEGVLSKDTIPWRFAIHYYLDGVEYYADQLAGKSGALKITTAIRENPDCNSTFFDNYGLQASFTLDTTLCKNIVAEGATAANVGADRQLTYTILPGNEKDITITADVTNFEMDSISVNGLPLNMDENVDTESNDDFNEAITDLEDAVKELDDGAGELLDGAEELRDGADELRDGATDLRDGANELTDGAAEARDGAGELYDGALLLRDNMAELHDGLSRLSAKSSELTGGAYAVFEQLCTSAQTQLNAALAENGMQPVTLTPGNYSAVLLGILSEMNAADVYTQAYNAALAEVTAQVEAQADSIYSGYIESIADTVYLQYINENADGIYLQYINTLPDSEKEQIYQQAAAAAVMRQLIATGMDQTQAQEYLATPEGQAQVASVVAGMTPEEKQAALSAASQSLSDEQKEQILAGALAALTEEQKEQIRIGAVASMSDAQKADVRNAYISQMMASDEVIERINAAVSAVNASAAQVSALKGQLDSYKNFYNGLTEYTSGVDEAASGSGELLNGTIELLNGTIELRNGSIA